MSVGVLKGWSGCLLNFFWPRKLEENTVGPHSYGEIISARFKKANVVLAQTG